MASNWMPTKRDRYLERGMILSCEYLTNQKDLFLFVHRFYNLRASKNHDKSIRLNFTGEMQSFFIAKFEDIIPAKVDIDLIETTGNVSVISYLATPLSKTDTYLLSQENPLQRKDMDYVCNPDSLNFKVYHPSRLMEIPRAIHKFLLMTNIEYHDILPVKERIVNSLGLNYENQPPHICCLDPGEEFKFLFELNEKKKELELSAKKVVKNKRLKLF